MKEDSSVNAEVASTVEQSLRKGEVVGSIPIFGSESQNTRPMSRLEQTRRKNYYSQILLYLFFFLLLIVFFATIGLKILVNTSLFVAELTSSEKNEEPELSRKDILLPPEITEIPAATNSSRVKIAGRADEKKTVSVFVNDEIQKELIADSDGFETEINLKKGKNEVFVKVEDPKNQTSRKSPSYTIIYKSEKPTLLIESPQEGEKLIRDEVVVSGVTGQEVIININGQPVVVSENGKFSHNVRLKEGENKITVAAVDVAKNSETREITVFYEK